MGNRYTIYTHDPHSLKYDIALIEKLVGTYDSDSEEFYNAVDNVLRFAKWAVLGTDGKLNKDK